MILTASLLAGLAFAWLLIGLIEKIRLGIALPQALLYVPFKLAWRISDGRIAIARKATAPVIYAVVHRSRVDPALMLSLLPLTATLIGVIVLRQIPGLSGCLGIAMVIAGVAMRKPMPH